MAQINIQYTADIQQLNAKLDQIIQKQEEVISSSQKVGNEMSKAVKKSAEEVGFLNNSLGKLQSAVASAFAIGKIWEFTKSIVEAERSMELLQNRLNFIAGSSEGGAKMFQRLLAVSKDLGINVNSLAEGMASFGLAATQAGFSANKTERIFVQMSSALRAAGASSLQSQRAFYALQQMMSKGVVSAEELRRQLAESLPAASEYMEQAYNRLHPAANLTEIEFTKLLESGKIISSEILPAFADVVEERLSPALSGKKNSLDAALQNAGTELTRLKLNLGNTAFIKGFVNLFSEQVERLNSTMESSLPTFQKLGIALGVLRGDISAQIAADSLKELQKSLSEIDAKKVDDIIEVSKEIMKLDTASRERKKEEYKQDLQAAQQIIDANANKVNSYKNEIAAAERAKEEKMKILEAEKMSVRDRFYKETEIQKEFLLQKRAIDKKYSLDDLQRQTTNAKDRLRIASGVLDEIQAAEKALQESRQRGAEEERQRQEQALKDAVALAKIRVEQAQKGSKEQTDAYVNLANKESELKEFMAKSTAEKQLAEVEGDKAVKKALSDGRVRDLQNQIAIENAKLSNVAKNSREELEIRKRVKLLEAKIAAENANLTKAQINALIDNAIIEINELEAKFNDSNFKQRKAAEKSGKEFGDNLRKIYREALYGSISDPMQLELEKTIDYYNDLIKEAGNNAKLIKQLEENKYAALDAIRQRFADKDQDREDTRLRRLARSMSQTINAVGDLIQQQIQLDIDANNQQLKNLEERYEKGLLSEEAYEKQKKDIQRRVFEDEKSMQIARAVMSGANAIISILGNPTLLPLAPVLIPLTAGLTVQQISLIQSQTPGFKDGVIDLKGPGTETSDSIVARLSRGESVMTAKETKKYKDVLEAIREDRLPSLIAEKYLIPAYEASIDKGSKSDVSKSSLELAFQTAELVQAVKGNKVINLSEKSVKSIASAMSKGRMMDKKMRRRGL